MKIRLGIILWSMGMIGVFLMLLLLPGMLINEHLHLSIWTISLIQLLQSGVILAISVWVGTTLSPKVNLHSPCIEALVVKNSLVKKLLPQLIPGCIGGLIVGVFLMGMNHLTPQELIANTQSINSTFKVLGEVFYGGITEEILLRWGMMTLVLWLLWRFIQRNQNNPSQLIIWVAIIASSLLFALGHLPAAYAVSGHLSINILTYIIGGNTIAGIIFGFLYQRYGLESAMLAHAAAHFIKDLLMLFSG